MDEVNERGRGQLDRARERAFRLVAAHYGENIGSELDRVLREALGDHVDAIDDEAKGELMSLILAQTWTTASCLDALAGPDGDPMAVLRAGEKGLEDGSFGHGKGTDPA